MKQKVSYSTASLVVTIAVTALLIYILFAAYGSNKFGLMAVLIVTLWGAALLYAPMWVELGPDCVTMRHPLRKTRLPLRDVAVAEPYQPTMGDRRIFGSGGYFGHWGIFSAADVGKYTAYYGKSSQCFMVRMKNGDKYVFGCENPAEITDAVNLRLKN